MTSPPIHEYLREIEKNFQRGDATEHTYRPALKSLIESLDSSITATNEPKRIACGAPDFILTRGQVPAGYIEAKDIGKHLEEIEREGQVARYRESLGNLILTDYLEFRWYVGGEPRMTARLARPGVGGRLQEEKGGAERTAELLSAFLQQQFAAVRTSKEFAARMAALARLIRAAIQGALESEDKGGSLLDQMEGFRQVLLPELTIAQFADMYAQTICYGLFAARCGPKAHQPFERKQAAYDLPETNPFLRKMFVHIAGPELDSRVAWAVDDVAELLDKSDIAAILQGFGGPTRREDPVIHFYETFLAHYDPKMREMRGVYYTPEPVVSYIVRSVDHILKTDFGLKDGLADSTVIPKPAKRAGKGNKAKESKPDETVHKVLILDPAAGTGTFLNEVICHIHRHLIAKRQSGAWSGYVSDHLLPRIFGFELLMAPYAISHMKLGMKLAETGYDFKAGERLRIYLTNTLEEAFETERSLPFVQWIADEANASASIKREAPVMVVLGNPPYSGHSANHGHWIAELLRGKDIYTNQPTGSYFEVDGQPLGERNPKWLNDDYVKFIRFAQWRIEQTGYGVLAFISNNGYLDNPTFRGMRQCLMKSFDEIYVLDLHGNSKKKEISPDGSKDENVFDIQQGVAIGIFVRRGGLSSARRGQEPELQMAQIRHAELWGLREIFKKNRREERFLIGGKYHSLLQQDLTNTPWKTLEPRSPLYLFVPQEKNLLAEYERGWRITEAMPINVLGFQTHRDHFAIDLDKDALHKRIAEMRSTRMSDDDYARKWGIKDNRDWKLSEARRAVRENKKWEDHLIQCLYRPFDKRYCYFSDVATDYPRRELLDHVAGRENLCLNTVRQTKMATWQHALVGDVPAPAVLVEIKDGTTVFPLYLYPNGDFIETLYDHDNGRRPNLASQFIADVSARLKMKFEADGKGDMRRTYGPENVFNYFYALLHSPSYRSRYIQFLKSDFPRIPLTSNRELFRLLAALGEEVIGIHLVRTRAPWIASYDIVGSDTIKKVRYSAPGQGAEKGRVWINDTQHFEGVPPEVWEFYIGGYQVCEKWLKDRKGRKMSYDDLAHYQNIIGAIAETIRLMGEIDAAIEENGGWPIQ